MIKNRIKKVAEKIPAILGCKLAGIPFVYRLGKSYSFYSKYIDYFNDLPHEKQKEEIFHKVKTLVTSAYSNVPFYSYFYNKKKYDIDQLKGFNDIKNIPIVTKNDLQKWSLIDRTKKGQKGIVTNTGGTSGQPLGLILDGEAYAREWAHMHKIWDKLGYTTKSLKLTVRGLNLESVALKYYFIHNEFQVNAYCDIGSVFRELRKITFRYSFEYLHGYPSGLFEFSKVLSQQDPDLFHKIKRNLKGVFLGSEFPAPKYRETLEELWDVPTISWYGHTEMAVLAYEKNEPFVYYPFQTYGYAEALAIDGKYHLVGTTIHNEIGPLIRYDTGDIITPETYQDGLLESFKITGGRIGEFVTDSMGRNISLTALIFGRHHKLFQEADFIQVKQVFPGELIVMVTTDDMSLNAADLFDSSGINMKFSFELIDKPIKTTSGKIALLVKDQIDQ